MSINLHQCLTSTFFCTFLCHKNDLIWLRIATIIILTCQHILCWFVCNNTTCTHACTIFLLRPYYSTYACSSSESSNEYHNGVWHGQLLSTNEVQNGLIPRTEWQWKYAFILCWKDHWMLSEYKKINVSTDSSESLETKRHNKSLFTPTSPVPRPSHSQTL